jgi:hypothetical protein
LIIFACPLELGDDAFVGFAEKEDVGGSDAVRPAVASLRPSRRLIRVFAGVLCATWSAMEPPSDSKIIEGQLRFQRGDLV